MGRVDQFGTFLFERNIQDLHVLSRHFDKYKFTFSLLKMTEELRILHVLNWIPA